MVRRIVEGGATHLQVADMEDDAAGASSVPKDGVDKCESALLKVVIDGKCNMNDI